MIKYLPYEEKYQDQMYDVFNELTKENERIIGTCRRSCILCFNDDDSYHIRSHHPYLLFPDHQAAEEEGQGSKSNACSYEEGR